VISSEEGGASLNILSGLVAGNFSAFWLGLAMMTLMAIGAWISGFGFGALMVAPRCSHSAWWRSGSWVWVR